MGMSALGIMPWVTCRAIKCIYSYSNVCETIFIQGWNVLPIEKPIDDKNTGVEKPDKKVTDCKQKPQYNSQIYWYGQCLLSMYSDTRKHN